MVGKKLNGAQYIDNMRLLKLIGTRKVMGIYIGLTGIRRVFSGETATRVRQILRLARDTK